MCKALWENKVTLISASEYGVFLNLRSNKKLNLMANYESKISILISFLDRTQSCTGLQVLTKLQFKQKFGNSVHKYWSCSLGYQNHIKNDIWTPKIDTVGTVHRIYTVNSINL